MDGDQFIFAGHDGRHGCVKTFFKAGIPVGDNTHQLAVIHHRHAGNILRMGQRQHIPDGGCGTDGDGILYHPALEFLDPPDFVGLLFDGHVFMHNT